MSARRNEIWADNSKEADARLRMVGTIANGQVTIDGVHVPHAAARKVVESLPRDCSADAMIRALKAVAPTASFKRH